MKFSTIFMWAPAVLIIGTVIFMWKHEDKVDRRWERRIQKQVAFYNKLVGHKVAGVKKANEEYRISFDNGETITIIYPPNGSHHRAGINLFMATDDDKLDDWGEDSIGETK